MTKPQNAKAIEANKAKTKAEEAQAATANAAKLATMRANAKPVETKAKPKGSGALIGVAAGAMDGQPHTKLAVAQARKTAMQNPDKLSPALRKQYDKYTATLDALLHQRTVEAGDKVKLARLTVLEKTMRDARNALFVERAPKAEKPAPTPKADKATRQPATADSRTIVVVAKTNPYKLGTKAHATFEMFKAKKTVAAAKAESEATGGSGAAGKYDIGYLRYASRDGHISFK